jgi:hypothetical protein
MRIPVLYVLASVAAGCAGQSGVTPVYDPATRELVRIDYDYDANGTVDVRTFMRAGRPARLEGDADGDGTVDRWEYYDASGRLERIGASSQQDGTEDTWVFPAGDETRMDLSTARDGRIDRREFYRGDLLVRAESDTDGDGSIDSWERFENGRLSVHLARRRQGGGPADAPADVLARRVGDDRGRRRSRRNL